jgi:hypothetical protein
MAVAMSAYEDAPHSPGVEAEHFDADRISDRGDATMVLDPC